MKITREQLRQWDACYNDAEIASLVPETGLTPLEVAALDIPAEDRLWVLLREDIIPARELRLLACNWAETACHAAGWNDKRSLAAIAVARRFACEDAATAEAESASRAAWSAARSSESVRVEAAASSAAWAAWSAALASAAEAAAWTAGAAARSAAQAESDRAAARAEQLADVVKILHRRFRANYKKRNNMNGGRT